jgi:putative Holliday junction resolvase
LTRLLGIDLGERRIGIAIADSRTGEIRPLTTLHRSTPKRDGVSIERLADEQQADEIVVGLPLMLDGSVGQQARATQDWAGAALAGLRQPTHWRDERLTTEQAIARVGKPARGSAGGPPSAAARRAYRARLDREAAANILQSELDERAGAGHGS